MKEIKFRAWDNGQMLYEVQFTYSFEHFICNEPNLLMQYTGMKDKNGKEIYKCDLLKCFYGGGQIGATEIVEFKNGAFWLRYRDVSIATWLEQDGLYNTGVEVIGNIYENPELLPK